MPAEDSITVKIAREVASYEGVDPGDLEPPLYDVINTDALETLFRSSVPTEVASAATLEFPYKNYTIRVTGSGGVDVLPRQAVTRDHGESQRLRSQE